MRRSSFCFGIPTFCLLVIAPWLAGVSCLNKADDSDNAAKYWQLRDSTICSMNFKCCSAALQQKPTQAECEKRGVFDGEVSQLEDAIANGTTTISLARAEGCFAEVRAMSCSAWAAALAGAVPASCTGIFSGKANGQACKTDAECTTQFCDLTSGNHTLQGPQSSGLCATPATAGGTCPATQSGCVPGTQCRGSGGTPVCTPFPAPGGACEKDIDCVSDRCTAGACVEVCWAGPNSHHLLGTKVGF